MLVLSRKSNESVCINDNVVVTVVSIQGDRVRLGIEAPREMPVHRREVHERIQKRKVPMTVG
jgi:carbon storage regulator